MTWALKRQIFYVIVLILFLLFFGFIIFYPKLSKEPSCMDGKQNGSETGVDCGGSCLRACVAEVDDLSVIWARAFEVLPGRYNAVAYVANHNKNTAIRKINYRFRFGDSKNVYVGKRDGSTFIPPGGNFAIFEPGIDVGHSVPVYTTFEFTEAPNWLQVAQNKIDQLKILISNIELVGEKTAPKLSASVRNTSLFTLKNLGVVAILYEANGNAVSVSRTYIGELKPLEEKMINFTWPKPFEQPIVEKELIPIYDIFSADLP